MILADNQPTGEENIAGQPGLPISRHPSPISGTLGTLVGFEVDNYDPAKTLVIDPVLSYSTYLGGSYTDWGYAIAVDTSGNAYVTGYTNSTNFPTAAGAYPTARAGSNDAFVAKLNSTGTALVYSTYLGGSGGDHGRAIAVDSSGNAYVTGYTGSTRFTNFPTTAGAYQTAFGGGGDAFVTKLNPTGTALVYSTYLGGSSHDYAKGIAVDSSGNAYVAGHTSSTNFPTTAGAYQTAPAGGTDTFVAKFSFEDAGGATTTPGASDFSGTYSGSGVTIHLAQSGSTLSGTFSTGTLSGNMGGFVDSSGRSYAWAWFDSGVVAGTLTVSGSQGTFSFGGGQSPGGRIGEIALSDMTKSTLSGSTTVTTGSTATNYAGTYTTAGLTITLTQSGSTLSGTFTSGSLSGTMSGFVDSSGRAYICAYWDSSSGSGVVAGSLTVSGTQASISFGGGNSMGTNIGEIVLSGLTRQ